MKDNIILVDCDGVLLDWEPFFFHFAKEKYGHEVVHEKQYNVGKALGLTPREGRKLVSEFNNSEAMTSLSPLRDAVKYIRKLFTEHGYQFHVITSQTKNPYAQAYRIYNLEKLFGEDVFHGFTILDQGADKDKELAKWKDTGCYWVEDKPANYTAGEELGLTPILMGHQHNVGFEGTVRWNWKEIYNEITGE
jgi:hypothetical protein